ncbi:MAG TPA: PhnD/SsuA/transferrin family substrate-binding protein [Acidimicrobiia bacterium]|nr:PhnD/SsuA/transferrin family substrate-binding protein [Acidimicrobiia bacterium]
MSRRIHLGGFYRSLPMLAAEEKGFYADHDVEVEFGQVTSSIQQAEYLSDGRYDVVQTSPDNTANYHLNESNPIGSKIDAQGFLGLDYGMYLVVVARPEIDSIAGLAGKTISVDAPESGFAYVIYKILANHGLERDRDYDIVLTGGVYDRFMAMVEGDGDFAATLMSGGFETRAANRGFRLLDSVSDIADPYLGVWAAARRDWLSENEDLVTDFVAAYLAASDWVFDPANREECEDLLQRAPNTSEDLAAQLYDVQVRPGVGNVPNGEIDPEAVRNVLALREEFGGFESKQDIDALVSAGTTLFTTRYLERARG